MLNLTHRSAPAFVCFLMVLSGCKDTNKTGPTEEDKPGDAIGFSPNRRLSTANLRQIAITMHIHNTEYLYLPPAAICDAKGNPLLSWRVAVLPYIEQMALYQKFRLNEPWDSDHNKKLIAEMPVIYLLPGSGKKEDGKTHYRAFASIAPEAGPNGAAFFWPDPKAPAPLPKISIENIKDGSINTVLIAEAAEPVIWTKPDEMIYDPSKPIPALLRDKIGNSFIVMGDGSVRNIAKDLSEKTLRALITANAGDLTGDDWKPD